MNCMKCGVEIEEGQAFCPSCLMEMEKYPVRPNVMVHLPQRREQPAAKKQAARKASLTKDERIARLRKRNRRLTKILLVALLLIAGLTAAVVRLALDRSKPQRGQNYSAVTTPTEGETDVSRETLSSVTG